MPSIVETRNRIVRAETTARGLAEAALDEAENLNDTLNAFLEIDREGALQRADQIDASSQKSAMPLAGVPVAIKDNICVRGMQTSCGSRILGPYHPPYNATAVERLLAAGAVIIGKANLSEWANFRSSHSTSGWSGRGGQTRNPYVLDRNPCGSSSGTGAAIASNLAAIGIGTETDGSVVCPANRPRRCNAGS